MVQSKQIVCLKQENVQHRINSLSIVLWNNRVHGKRTKMFYRVCNAVNIYGVSVFNFTFISPCVCMIVHWKQRLRLHCVSISLSLNSKSVAFYPVLLLAPHSPKHTISAYNEQTLPFYTLHQQKLFINSLCLRRLYF